jgi:hypothetical protein
VEGEGEHLSLTLSSTSRNAFIGHKGRGDSIKKRRADLVLEISLKGQI